MLFQHACVVHLVDMVAAEHEHVLRIGLAHDVQVLVDGVGRTAVPGVVQALLRRHHVDVLPQARFQKPPATLDVPDQALRLVLCQHGDAPNPRIDAIAEREVDDLQLAGERHRRLGAPIGELHQPAAAPTGQHQRVGALRQRVQALTLRGRTHAGRGWVGGGTGGHDRGPGWRAVSEPLAKACPRPVHHWHARRDRRTGRRRVP